MTQKVSSQLPFKTLARTASFAIHAVLTISQLLEYWEENERVAKDKIDETCRFLSVSHG